MCFFFMAKKKSLGKFQCFSFTKQILGDAVADYGSKE